MNGFLTTYFNTIKKFMPGKSEGTSVGLDIGVAECKLVEISQEAGQYQLVTCALEPIVKGDVKTAVTNILGKCKIPSKSPNTAVFGKGTLIRYVKMPRMSISDLKSSFDLESDKYFPFASDQIYTDCYILDPLGKEKQMSVLATAVRRELIDTRVALLKEQNLEVNFIGINSIALCNALSVLGCNNEKNEKGGQCSVVGLLDLGESVSNLNILVDGSPRFTRDIFIGSRDFTIRISNALGVTIEEAEKLKKNHGERIKEVINACEMTVMNIVDELILSFDFFTTEQNLEVKQLLLTGGGSLLNGLDEIFEKNLEMTVSQWDPMDGIVVSPQLDREDIERKSLKFGVAIGLALYSYD